jgi:hypothetical protein
MLNVDIASGQDGRAIYKRHGGGAGRPLHFRPACLLVRAGFSMDSSLGKNRYRRGLIVAGIVALAILPGCVRRRLVIRSNPPGAMVYVDNQPIGTTPCATSFVYYGTREIRLVKPGYETLTINQPIPAPWYQLPPIDFVSENIVPNEIQDYRTVAYNLTPQVIVPTDQLIARGEQLRAGTQQGAVLPAGANLPWSTPVLAPPTIAGPAQTAPAGPLAPGTTLAPEAVPPGVIVPPSTGSGVLPPGGRVLEPLPAIQQ